LCTPLPSLRKPWAQISGAKLLPGCRDDEGDEEDGVENEEEDGEERKSQFGEHEDGAGDLTRQSSGAPEDADGLPSAALRVLEHVEDGPDKRRSGRLWRSAKERWVWRKDATMVSHVLWVCLTLYKSAMVHNSIIFGFFSLQRFYVACCMARRILGRLLDRVQIGSGLVRMVEEC
jgi:hypothetical protein